ncbi:MAG: glutamine-hydrolyzing GMP synthase [Peptococcia bacterium]
MAQEHELVLVIDFGGHDNQLIARRIRELQVFSEVVPYNTSAAEIKAKDPLGLIFSGYPASTGADNALQVDPQVFDLGLPVLENGSDLQLYTTQGMDKLKEFLFQTCGCKGEWTVSSFIDEQVAMIRQQVGERQVLCALSGGVDSSVAAVLVHKAIGDQLTCVFVNHGFMRKGEPEQIKAIFQDKFQIKLVFVDARERFMEKIRGVSEPETKRKIIGNEFIRVFEDEAAKLGKIDFLVQGTVYPDVVESGGTSAKTTIKSHHNVGGLPEDMKFQLIEPLRMLFKDEVRAVGRELGLPEEIVGRQPFPGPGLAIRIIGEITEEKLEILREADAIILEEIRQAGLYQSIWQSFAILPSVRTVGVTENERTYGYPIVLRAVTSDDAMTAEWARLPYELLEHISQRIVNEVKGVNRLVYDVTGKPPGTIEWE